MHCLASNSLAIAPFQYIPTANHTTFLHKHTTDAEIIIVIHITSYILSAQWIDTLHIRSNMVTREKRKENSYKNISLSTGCAHFSKYKNQCRTYVLCHWWWWWWWWASMNSRKKNMYHVFGTSHCCAYLLFTGIGEFFYRSNILLGLSLCKFWDRLSCVINFQSSYLFDNLFTVSVEIFTTNVTPFF